MKRKSLVPVDLQQSIGNRTWGGLVACWKSIADGVRGGNRRLVEIGVLGGGRKTEKGGFGLPSGKRGTFGREQCTRIEYSVLKRTSDLEFPTIKFIVVVFLEAHKR
ncbi:hypothetical protein ACLOJK_019330 [Asimina triloba]